jgi:hypothetical protein
MPYYGKSAGDRQSVKIQWSPTRCESWPSSSVTLVCERPMNRCAVAKRPSAISHSHASRRAALASEHGTVEHVPANAERAVLVHDGPPLIEQRDKRDESGGRGGDRTDDEPVMPGLRSEPEVLSSCIHLIEREAGLPIRRAGAGWIGTPSKGVKRFAPLRLRAIPPVSSRFASRRPPQKRPRW